MDLKLQKKHAIVTGGSKGIGKGIAKALAEEGCCVSICARTKDELKATADELRETAQKYYLLKRISQKKRTSKRWSQRRPKHSVQLIFW